MDRDADVTEMSFWWWLLSAAAGSMSLISLIQRAWDIGVAGSLKSLIDFYRLIFYPLTQPIYAALQFVLPFHLPELYKDLFLLAFLFALVSMRAVPDATGRKQQLHPASQTIVDIMSALLLAVLLIGLAAPPHGRRSR